MHACAQVSLDSLQRPDVVAWHVQDCLHLRSADAHASEWLWLAAAAPVDVCERPLRSQLRLAALVHRSDGAPRGSAAAEVSRLRPAAVGALTEVTLRHSSKHRLQNRLTCRSKLTCLPAHTPKVWCSLSEPFGDCKHGGETFAGPKMSLHNAAQLVVDESLLVYRWHCALLQLSLVVDIDTLAKRLGASHCIAM